MLDTNQNLNRQVHAEELSGLPVDTSVLFSDHKGRYRRRIEKRQRKMLAKLGFLAPFLEPGEKILHVISGCSPISYVEQFLKGALLYLIKRSLFIVTNKRILHVPTTPRLSYRGSIAQILYADCMRLHIRFSTLIARYKSGRVEKFPCVSFRGRRKARALLRNMSREGRPSDAFERAHLCPRCTQPLIRNYYTCPHCSLVFKSKACARALSIIFPGGGYFYTRHPLLGILDLVMQTLFVLLLGAILVAFFMTPPGHQQQQLKHAILTCAIVLVFEKLVAVLHAHNFVDEFIPKHRHVEEQADGAAAYSSLPRPEEMLSTGWRSR